MVLAVEIASSQTDHLACSKSQQQCDKSSQRAFILRISRQLNTGRNEGSSLITGQLLLPLPPSPDPPDPLGGVFAEPALLDAEAEEALDGSEGIAMRIGPLPHCEQVIGSGSITAPPAAERGIVAVAKIRSQAEHLSSYRAVSVAPGA
jgi:hypothetical protein